MRNATKSLLWVLVLGTAVVASPVAAQTDETEGSAEGEGTPDATEDQTASDVEEATPEQPAPPEEADPEPEVSTPAEEAAGTTLASPTSELEDGDLAESAEDSAEGETEAGGAEEEAASDAPSPAELPWRNTFFYWSHQATFNTFWRGAQLSYDPVYIQYFSVSPRWYLAPTSYFVVTQGLQIELTDGDTALNRDPQLSDTVVEFRQMIPWEGFVFMGQARITLPVSKLSQAAQVYLGTGLGATIVRPIPEINLTLAGVFRWSHTFAGSNVVRVGEPQPDMCPAQILPTTPGGGATAPEFSTSSCDQLGTATSASDSLLYGISATLAFDALTFSLQAFFLSSYGYGLAPWHPTPGQILTDNPQAPRELLDGSPTHWRNYTYFSLSAGYQFTPWLNVSVGIQNSANVASAWNPDGSVRNPIFTPDTQAFLAVTAQLDTIYTELAGQGEQDLTPEERQRRRQGLAAAPSTGGTF